MFLGPTYPATGSATAVRTSRLLSLSLNSVLIFFSMQMTDLKRIDIRLENNLKKLTMSDTSRKSKSWGNLFYTFSQETTFHGIRYIGARSFIVRRYEQFYDFNRLAMNHLRKDQKIRVILRRSQN